MSDSGDYPTILLSQGATALVEVDLTGFDLRGGVVIFTMREKHGAKAVVKECAFDTPETHTIVFADEFTATLDLGDSYEYDLMHHLDGERFAQCEPTSVKVSRTVGGCRHGAGD